MESLELNEDKEVTEGGVVVDPDPEVAENAKKEKAKDPDTLTTPTERGATAGK